MKHEKAFLVLLSYIIGFTTAYIAFGLVVQSSAQPTIAVITPSQNTLDDDNTQSTALGVMETAEGLFALLGERERVLSAQAISFSAGAGYHHNVFFALPSPDGQYIYYCAQERQDAAECASYVYSVASDTTHQVSNENDDPVFLQATDTAVWEVGQLYLPTYRSYDTSRPWEVISY